MDISPRGCGHLIPEYIICLWCGVMDRNSHSLNVSPRRNREPKDRVADTDRFGLLQHTAFSNRLLCGRDGIHISML